MSAAWKEAAAESPEAREHGGCVPCEERLGLLDNSQHFPLFTLLQPFPSEDRKSKVTSAQYNNPAPPSDSGSV